MPRAVVVVLDSFGVGASPDADRFGDAGADTFGHIAAWCAGRQRPLRLSNMVALGLAHAAQRATGQWPRGLPVVTQIRGAFGIARETSLGKDTPSGHWELMGCPVPFDWGYFARNPDPKASVFPPELMQRWYAACSLGGSLCNQHGSGTEIIRDFGDEHIRTGLPICYTSSDSVFQIAAHVGHFGLERLYEICRAAKPIFDEMEIARVIARPFDRPHGNYQRCGGRKDFTTPPPHDTLLDILKAAGREVHAVGKVSDIFAGRGVTHYHAGADNEACCMQTLRALESCADGGLVFTNLVDFDMIYGHRRDPAGYADALEVFDRFLPQLQSRLRADDVLVLTADHGCDPTWQGSDHTREYVPVLLSGQQVTHGIDFGVRESFADVGATLASFLHLEAPLFGRTLFSPASDTTTAKRAVGQADEPA